MRARTGATGCRAPRRSLGVVPCAGQHILLGVLAYCVSRTVNAVQHKGDRPDSNGSRMPMFLRTLWTST